MPLTHVGNSNLYHDLTPCFIQSLVFYAIFLVLLIFLIFWKIAFLAPKSLIFEHFHAEAALGGNQSVVNEHPLTTCIILFSDYSRTLFES